MKTVLLLIVAFGLIITLFFITQLTSDMTELWEMMLQLQYFFMGKTGIST
jgi:hypothetical protein|tara:strand:- start:137 stop:286 length:150 start_codon:yes stop_codon:yes gene_type:complete